MNTLILEQPGQLTFGQTAEPNKPQPGEALVRIHRVGICGTDLHAYRGKQPYFTYPRIPGHELGVEIVEINHGGLLGLRQGDRCAVEPYMNCGECIACRRGKTNCCTRMKVLGVHIDGGMRDLITVPVHKLHRANRLSFEQLALVETLGIGAHAVDRAQPQAGEWALVIGAGPIGLTAMQFAKLAGTNLIVMDVNADRLGFAQQHLGVTHAINIAGQSIEENVKALQDRLNGDLPTLVFDATGNAQSMMQAFQYVAHGGKLVYVGLVLDDITFNDPFFHGREITLFASRNATAKEFKMIIGAMEDGRIDVQPWITHRAPAQAVPDTFPEWLKPENKVIKAMIEWN